MNKILFALLLLLPFDVRAQTGNYNGRLSTQIISCPSPSGGTSTNVLLTDTTTGSHWLVAYATGHPTVTFTSSSTGAVSSTNIIDSNTAHWLMSIANGRLQFASTSATTGAVNSVQLVDTNTQASHTLTIANSRGTVN